MNGGELIQTNRPKEVVIQRLASIAEDPDGFETDVWEDYYKSYAYVNGLSGNERWAAAQVMTDRVDRFTFRWHEELDDVVNNWKRYRIVWCGRIYTITYADNVMYRNETVKIDAVGVET